jgi:hypothetical protein
MPQPSRRTFLDALTKKEALLFGGLGIFAVVMLMAAMTDYGTQSPFRKANFVFALLWVNAVVMTAAIFINRYCLIKKKT